MSLPIDLTGKLAKINGDLNVWGAKINANELELADGINEVYEGVLEINGISTGLGLKQNKTDNTLTTTSKTIVGAINELNANKQTSLVSGTNIKTINGDSLLGSGNFVISGGEGGLIKQFATLTEALNNTTLVAEDVVQTLGKTTKGDGLGRKYIIKSTDNGTFLPYGSLFFNLIDEGDSTIGSVSLLAHENIPNWAVKCDGTEYLITQYPQLFAKIGNVYGGDGITTFKVPNITDYIITL